MQAGLTLAGNTQESFAILYRRSVEQNFIDPFDIMGQVENTPFTPDFLTVLAIQALL
jgi:hypothetical protein